MHSYNEKEVSITMEAIAKKLWNRDFSL